MGAIFTKNFIPNFAFTADVSDTGDKQFTDVQQKIFAGVVDTGENALFWIFISSMTQAKVNFDTF